MRIDSLSRRGPFHLLQLTLLLTAALLLPATAFATTDFGGFDQFRISAMGPDGDDTFDAISASVAYDPVSNEFLVVWSGDTDEGDLVEGELEIWGQRLDGDSGAPLGARIRISDAGPEGSTDYRATSPDVVYNSSAGEFLVVWQSSDEAAAFGEEEIWGQRLEAGTGVELGSNDFRISNQGTDGASNADARAPAVAYNTIDDEYLVVWGGDGGPGLENDEFEIWGQRLEGASGSRVGDEGFRISSMGPDGDTAFDATEPDVAHNAIDNEYLVVWHSDDDEPPLDNNIFGVWAQVLDGATGVAVGENRLLSDVVLSNGANRTPAVAHAASSNLFLVVWPGRLDNSLEIAGQLIDGETLVDVGVNMRFSDMGPDGNTGFNARRPSVVYVPTQQEFQVFWDADDNTAPYQNNDNEIFGQRVDASSGAEIGRDFGLSRLGTVGQTQFGASAPAAATGSGGQVLVVCQGDTNDGDRVDEEFEIHGLLPPLFADSFESGDLSAWSDSVP